MVTFVKFQSGEINIHTQLVEMLFSEVAIVLVIALIMVALFLFLSANDNAGFFVVHSMFSLNWEVPWNCLSVGDYTSGVGCC